MKLIIVIVSIFLSCQALSNAKISRKWAKFQIDFGKSYKSPVEASKRFGIFKNNLANIEEHNRRHANGEVTWTKTITKFTDWTSEEFLDYVNKGKIHTQTFPEELKSTEKLITLGLGDHPPTINWRDLGAVTEVKDQGSCGSSWSFSATGAIESQYRIERNIRVSLSEQNLIDCVKPSNDSENGCNGGDMVDAFKYIYFNGIETEVSYPYEGIENLCRQQGYEYKIDGYFPIVTHTEDRLLGYVGNVGPTSVAIQATENLQLYGGGVLYDPLCTGDELNQGVLVVGYDSENGEDYWLVKNSWGPSWGENGFFKLSRKDNNCGIQNMASLPIVLDIPT